MCVVLICLAAGRIDHVNLLISDNSSFFNLEVASAFTFDVNQSLVLVISVFLS